jgi:hypothetical protein
MKTTTQSEIHILNKPHALSGLNQQAILFYKNGKTFLKAFYLIFDNRKIKKLHFKQPILIEGGFDLEKSLLKRLFEELSINTEDNEKSNWKRAKSKKRKVDDCARKTAAKNLYTDLGI